MKRSLPESSTDRDKSRRRMTQETAGEKEWKWDHYFREVDPSIRGQIEMDEVALFSVTVDKMMRIPSRSASVSIFHDSAKVCDATACVGGNTMSFAKLFLEVHVG